MNTLNHAPNLPPPAEETVSELRPETPLPAEAENPAEDTPLQTVSDANEPASAVKKRKKRNKKKAKTARPAESTGETKLLGTSRGVETMFRNAVRSEMEMLALAATKANIMISLNGFIVSALMISGAFIFSSSPEFLIPASTFMLTAATSIVFALLSASPERIGRMQAAREWLKDWFKGQAKFGDWKARVLYSNKRFFGSEPNILIYEDRVKLPQNEYWDKMRAMMDDRETVYQKMSEHLYWLGLLANKQFKYINLSYAVFRWGLLASLAAFIGVKTIPALMPAQSRNLAELRPLGINMLTGVYEPSAVQQLPDGRILVAEDEADHAFSILSIDENGNFVEDEALDTRIVRGFKQRLNDLESLARDGDGFMYALTSHSRNKKGERSPDRERLLRFKIQGGTVLGLTSYDKLAAALESDTRLHGLIRQRAKVDEVSFKDLDIESMTYDLANRRLVLGFRDPEFNNRALVVFISNPREMFEQNADPVFSDAAILDINGGGIRSLNYDAVLQTYLIANEVKDENGEKYSQLWQWSGNPKDEAQTINLPNLRHMINVEAMDSVIINGKPQLMLMSDEGDAAKGITAKYMLVDYQELKQK